MSVAVGFLSALPNPDPSAPAELRASASTVLGLIKWVSLIAGIAALMGFGLLALAADRGGYGSQAADMKESLGKVIIAIVIVCSATSLVTFVAG